MSNVQVQRMPSNGATHRRPKSADTNNNAGVSNGHVPNVKSSFVITENDDERDYHRTENLSPVSNGAGSKQDALFDQDTDSSAELKPNKQPFKMQIVWRNVATMTLLHIFGFYGWYLSIRYAKWQTFVWAYCIANFGGLGVLAGAHRLWTHRSFKAHWSVRFMFMIMQTIALQNDIYEWVRDHRAHHKYSETDADPHNSKRGFFFAHVGWLLCRKHPMVKEKGQQIDLSDVWADPIVRFQRRFYIPLVLLLWGALPVVVPYYLWKDPLVILIFGNFFRYVVSLHHAWLVNSAAHIYGYRQYEKSMEPRENYLVTYLSLGEGYHNYHHTFPWDYSASEHGWKSNFNVTTAMIDMLAWFGLVTDRRVVSRSVVEKRVARTGDHSIIPPSMSTDRKPASAVLDAIIGTVITTWPLWVSFLLRQFFHQDISTLE